MNKKSLDDKVVDFLSSIETLLNDLPSYEVVEFQDNGTWTTVKIRFENGKTLLLSL